MNARVHPKDVKGNVVGIYSIDVPNIIKRLRSMVNHPQSDTTVLNEAIDTLLVTFNALPRKDAAALLRNEAKYFWHHNTQTLTVEMNDA